MEVTVTLQIPFMSCGILVVINSERCIRLIERLYPHISVSHKGSREAHLRLSFSGETYFISNDKMVYASLTEQEALFVLFELVETLAEQSMSTSSNLILHGGLVSREGHAVGIVARANVGKSTLVLALSCENYEYMADDCIVIDSESGFVVPFHRPIKLRNLRPFGCSPHIQLLAEGRSPIRSEYTYLAVCDTQSPVDPVPLRSIVLAVRPAAPPSMRRLSVADAYAAIVRNAKIPSRQQIIRTNRQAMALVRTLSVYEIRYESLDDANRLIDEIYFAENAQ